MATFQDDLDSDLDHVFATTDNINEVTYARAGTFRRISDAAEVAVDIYSLELLYSVFDPKNQVKFFLRADQVIPGGGAYIPQPNDEVDDDDATGETFVILNVIIEENLFNVTAQRMDVRQ